jgi:hypothetical protein
VKVHPCASAIGGCCSCFAALNSARADNVGQPIDSLSKLKSPSLLTSQCRFALLACATAAARSARNILFNINYSPFAAAIGHSPRGGGGGTPT